MNLDRIIMYQIGVLFCFSAHTWFEFTNTLNEAVSVKVFFDNQQYREFLVLPNANSGKLFATTNNENVDRYKITKVVFVGTNDVISGWNYVSDAPGNNWGSAFLEKKTGDYTIDNPLGIATKTFPLRLRIMEQANPMETNLILSQLPAIYTQLYPNVAIGGAQIIAQKY